MKKGILFNPDGFVVPHDKLVQGKPAAITVQFSEVNGKTKVLVGQFVALDRLPGITGLFTLVMRTYTHEDTLKEQLVKGGKHGRYDHHKPHFHTKPHEDRGATHLSTDADDIIESKYFTVELYLVSSALSYFGDYLPKAREAGKALYAGAEGAAEAAFAATETVEAGEVAIAVGGVLWDFAAVAGVGALAFSDLALKTDIKRIGTSPRGIPTYKFRYKSAEHSPSGESTTEYIGTMAQDLVELEPSAVSVGTDGFYRVDYSKIDVDFKAVA